MASSKEFVEFVCDQISGAGEITCKKMFGEYGVYCNGKIIGLICNDEFFIKITEQGKQVIPNCEEKPPYQGAKPYLLISELDNRELMEQLIVATYKALPEPKPKKKK